ncbi:MAG: aspartate kinase [Chthonomonadaceae bacterium]|nr:aspartate kinase [Chthonomonadaceae bacterium]
MSVPASETQAPNVSFERERGVHAIQITRDVAHAEVALEDDSLRSARILQVFRVLANSGVPIFLTKLHRAAITFAFVGADLPRVEDALKTVGLQSSARRDLALISVRAASMRDLSGIMVAIADALYAAGARLFETGDSHNSVVCLIESAHVDEAVRQLRATFRLENGAVQEYPLGTEGAG